jgi:hypothetical protein
MYQCGMSVYDQRLITKEEDLSQVRSFEYQIHTGTHSLSDMGMLCGNEGAGGGEGGQTSAS